MAVPVGDAAGSSMNVGLTADMADEGVEHVEDVERTPEPPQHVEGAQWDEVHRRWEQWDEATGRWVVVGDPGDGVDPAAENPIDAVLARELLVAERLEAHDDPPVPDVDRAPEPPAHVPGAQWNEVAARWEHWDEARGEWVEVPPAP
jgi:hypothetical protein